MAQSKDKIAVSVKLDEDIRDMAVNVARAKGIDLSEHIRSLVIQDLDTRGLLAARVRMQVQVSVRLPPGRNEQPQQVQQ